MVRVNMGERVRVSVCERARYSEGERDSCVYYGEGEEQGEEQGEGECVAWGCDD